MEAEPKFCIPSRADIFVGSLGFDDGQLSSVPDATSAGFVPRFLLRVEFVEVAVVSAFVVRAFALQIIGNQFVGFAGARDLGD